MADVSARPPFEELRFRLGGGLYELGDAEYADAPALREDMRPFSTHGNQTLPG